jgi:hypothetical protein
VWWSRFFERGGSDPPRRGFETARDAASETAPRLPHLRGFSEASGGDAFRPAELTTITPGGPHRGAAPRDALATLPFPSTGPHGHRTRMRE